MRYQVVNLAGLGRFDPRQAAFIRRVGEDTLAKGGFTAGGETREERLAAATTQGAAQEAELLTEDGTPSDTPPSGGSAAQLCACYMRQVASQIRAQGASPSRDQLGQLEAACRANPAAFKANAASAGLALSDVCPEKSNTWLWLAGGAAVLGAFYLLRK